LPPVKRGMMIRGRGVAVDSLIGDYIAGAIELEIDRSVAEGYEYILSKDRVP